MFGLKKKESTDTAATVPEGANKFQVHTMQDDINHINGTTPKSGAKNTIKPDSSKQNTKDSPFFANASTPQEGPKALKTSPWLTDESQKKPSQNQVVKTPQNHAPAPNLDREIKIPTKTGESHIAKVTVPDNQITPATPKNDIRADLSQSTEERTKVNVPTSSLDTLGVKNEVTSEVSKATDRSPINAIEAEISSLTKKNDTRDGITSEKITTFSPLTQTPEEMFKDMGGPVKDDGKVKISKKKKKGGLKKLLKILIALLILTLLGIGGYFGYKYIQEQSLVSLDDLPGADIINPTPDEDVEVPDQVVVEQNEPEVVERRYAVDFPNYIELTDDTGESEEFGQEIREIAQNLPLQNPTAPISFLITDPEGTPLTFEAFALLTNMTLPPAVLDQAGDAFEIYAYENLGDVRFGIGFEYLDKQQMSNALSDHEIVLPQAFKPLYNDLSVTAPTAFADNVYGNYSVRFSNLRPDESLSIDYTLADKVYVGTSMMSQRSILDKYAIEEIR